MVVDYRTSQTDSNSITSTITTNDALRRCTQKYSFILTCRKLEKIGRP